MLINSRQTQASSRLYIAAGTVHYGTYVGSGYTTAGTEYDDTDVRCGYVIRRPILRSAYVHSSTNIYVKQHIHHLSTVTYAAYTQLDGDNNGSYAATT
jgi:hypothetical protein